MARREKQQIEPELPFLLEDLFGSVFGSTEIPVIVPRESAIDITATVHYQHNRQRADSDAIDTVGESVDE